MYEKVIIHVRLLEEGASTTRPTEALKIEDGKYKILPTKDYDPEDEVWEFVPGSIVSAKKVDGLFVKNKLLAISLVTK
jgi:hypothetical protein